MTDQQALQDVDLTPLLAQTFDFARRNFRLDPRGIHGVAHWEGVRRWGHVLLEGEGLATDDNRLLVDLFGLLHDVAREHDGRDRFHGQRSGRLVRGLPFLADLPEEFRTTLSAACFGHVGGTSPPSTLIGLCWDADRLDLSRFYWRIHDDCISSATGRRIAAELSQPHPLDVEERRRFYGVE